MEKMIRVGQWAGKTALLFLAAVLSFSSVPAQTPDSVPQRRPNSLEPGAWALQFEASRSIVTSFQGFGISLKYHFSNRSALRFGVGLSLSNSDLDDNGRVLQADTIRQKFSRGADANDRTFETSMQLLFYPVSKADLNLFLGAGPLVRFRHSSYKAKSISTYDTTTYEATYAAKINGWSLGGSGLFGAEWFATKNISFHGEYGLSFRYDSDRRTSNETGNSFSGPVTRESEGTQKSFRFDFSSVRFGFSVYF